MNHPGVSSVILPGAQLYFKNFTCAFFRSPRISAGVPSNIHPRFLLGISPIVPPGSSLVVLYMIFSRVSSMNPQRAKHRTFPKIPSEIH